ncbi:MAG: DUF4438 domain-containing protein [Candidatus Dormibacteraeota bacterium]|jgi:hypothetical protein|nr:DUF4438 domain-containing protein [Candidatus Dormibacteraeota bacterium]
MIRTNAGDLVEAAIGGEVWPPAADRNPYKVDSEGVSAVTLGMGGICFTHRVGDPAFGWEGDHLEPGVSIRNSDPGAEHALHYMVCVGNEAVVTSGACSGVRGVVSGEHAHVLVDFPPEAIEMLAIGDRIQIRSVGLGLRLLDYPDVVVHKMSPRLLDAIGVESVGGAQLSVPVVGEIPARFMGSGGELNADYVDQDFMTGDRKELSELGLDRLRIGDIVAVPDHNHTWGRGYRAGAMTIGLIIHGDSAWTGHGPGVLDLMSTTAGVLVPVIDPDANIALKLGIRSKQELEARRSSTRVSSFARR